jgi:hypothetical protein
MCIPSNGQRLASFGRQAQNYVLARIQFDNQTLVDRRGQIFAGRVGLEHALASLCIDFDPLGKPRDSAASIAALLRRWPRLASVSWITSPGRTLYDGIFTRLPLIRTPLWRTTLASLGAGGAKAHAIGNGVQTALQQLQQVLAGLMPFLRSASA